MDGTARLLRGFALAFAVGAGLSASALSPAQAASDTAEGGFADEFAPYAALPPEPEAGGLAVDLSTFDPPVEPAPEPDQQILRTLGTGVASFYGRRFHGRLTANGERFNMNAMTAAHKTLPFGTKVRVTNQRNGKSVVVRINDRGPFVRGRTIDVSRGAAKELGIISRGHGRVTLEIVR